MEGKRNYPFLKRLMALMAAPLLFLLLLPGCEQVFTYSPFAFLARDPSSLPMEQRISYAQLALSSGDKATLQAAYEAIASSTDPEVQYLASQVAVGASGLNEAVETALADMENIDVNSVVGSLDQTYLQNAGAQLASASEAGVEIADEDYVVAAAALLLSAALSDPTSPEDFFTNDLDFATATDPANVPADYASAADDTERAAYLFSQTGYTADDMDSLLAMIGG